MYKQQFALNNLEGLICHIRHMKCTQPGFMTVTAHSYMVLSISV